MLNRVLLRALLLSWVAGFFALAAEAQVPSLLNYQGRIAAGGTAFDGTGRFKLALVNADASQFHWRNANDANADGEPDAAVSLSVDKGVYSVALGDTSVANMAALPANVFTSSSVYLRVWFNDGTNGFQRLTPDQRITAVGYAMMAATVSDGAISAAKLDAALAAQMAALSNRLSAVESSTGRGLTTVSSDPADTNLLAKGHLAFSSVPAASWATGTSADAPRARSGHTAVWTGQEMIVWGGRIAAGAYSAAGGSYRPDLDTWTTVSTISAPTARSGHTAVWTGQEMIIWGGISTSDYLNTGGRFKPDQQLWSAVTTTSAPSGRDGHVAVWTGTRMVIWGGRDGGGLLASGGLYNPTTGQWTTLSLANAPAARAGASAVWTGDRLVVWGGGGASGALNSGAQLVFDVSGTPTEWRTMSTVNAPSARAGHSAVWSGERMIVFGGASDGGSCLNSGGLYNPATDTWTTLPSDGAPSARSRHSAIWIGAEMAIVNGETASGAIASGGAFDPGAGRWRALSSTGGPQPRIAGSAVWSGTKLLVFGGEASGQPLAALQRLNAQPAWYFYRKP